MPLPRNNAAHLQRSRAASASRPPSGCATGPALRACPPGRCRQQQSGAGRERCSIRFRLRRPSTERRARRGAAWANWCDAVHIWAAWRGANLLMVDHIVRANNFSGTSVTAGSRAEASHATSRAIPRRKAASVATIAFTNVAGLKSAIMGCFDTPIPVQRSFHRHRVCRRNPRKSAYLENCAGVSILAGRRSA